MRYISATEADQGLAMVLDTAQREPVVNKGSPPQGAGYSEKRR